MKKMNLYLVSVILLFTGVIANKTAQAEEIQSMSISNSEGTTEIRTHVNAILRLKLDLKWDNYKEGCHWFAYWTSFPANAFMYFDMNIMNPPLKEGDVGSETVQLVACKKGTWNVTLELKNPYWALTPPREYQYYKIIVE